MTRKVDTRTGSGSLTRRQFGKGALAAGAAAAVGFPNIIRAEDKELVVISYGGELQEPHRWLGDRMEARHPGLKVRLVASESQDIVAQIKAARGHSPYDAMPNGEPPHLIAMNDGYIQKRDDSKLANLGNVYPEFLEKTNGYGVPATFSLIGIAYNEEMVSTAPTGPGRISGTRSTPGSAGSAARPRTSGSGPSPSRRRSSAARSPTSSRPGRSSRSSTRSRAAARASSPR